MYWSGLEARLLEEHLARQREAVAVDAGARQPDNDVAFCNTGAGEHGVGFDDADTRTDEVEAEALALRA